MSIHPCAIMNDWSLEITARDADRLEACANIIPAGTKILVAFIPNETIDERISAASRVRALGFVPVPHISARRLRSREELEQFLSGLQSKAQVDRVLVIAGDPAKPLGPYEDALAVIESGLLGQYGIKSVGIAGYPQGHPAISVDQLWRAKHEKRDALLAQDLDFVVATQFGFDADAILHWVAEVRKNGIEGRIRIGVPGPTNAQRLLNFARRCGVEASTSVLKKYGLRLSRLLTTTTPEHLLEALAAGLDPSKHGEVLLHFYPFGGLGATAEWIETFCAKNRCDRRPSLDTAAQTTRS